MWFWIVSFVLGWLACSVGAYLLFRDDWKSKFGTWNEGDRLNCGLLSLLGGPIALIVAFSFWVKPKIAPWFGDMDEPASW